jgi:hypothetical protein
VTDSPLKTALIEAVRQPTLRSAAPGKTSPVKTPKPRLALRVGFTGHRPGRLGKAAAKNGLSMEAYEAALGDILASVFDTVQRDASRAVRAITYTTKDGTAGRFYADEIPLLRLVTGLALGTDALAARVVAERFRGPLRDIESIAAPTPPMPPEGYQAEWRIDGILPCRAASFILDAAGDYAIRFPDAAKAPSLEAFTATWSDTLALPDTLLTLPAGWRTASAAAPDLPDWLKAGRAQLHAAFGEEERRPEGTYALDYVASAEFLLRQIDVLVAVWDGEASAGPGGAPDIAAQAHEAGLPVIVIDAGDLAAPPRLLRGVKRAAPAPGVIGWSPAVLAPEVEAADCRIDALYEAIVSVISPPEPGGDVNRGHGDHRADRDRLIDFLEEDWPEYEAPKTYDSVIALFGRHGKVDWSSFLSGRWGRISPHHWSETSWTDFILSNPDEGLQGLGLKRILHRRFVLSDLLAVRYGDLYRAAVVKSYFWAALATLAALAGFLSLDDWAYALPVKAGLILLELLILGAIITMVRKGRSDHWHSKFVDYRLLAESLRHLRFLATFGEFAAAGRLNDSGSAWWGWYLRATARELGLPQGRLGPEFQRSLLSDVATFEIEEQIDYNRRTLEKARATGHGLHAWGDGLFIGAMVFLAGALALLIVVFAVAFYKAWGAGDGPAIAAWPGLIKYQLPKIYEWIKHIKLWIGVVAALLPTLGAALAGIRYLLDFDGKATSCQEMLIELERLSKEIDRAKKEQDFNTTRAVILNCSQVLAEDVAEFLSLYGRKQLTLPG